MQRQKDLLCRQDLKLNKHQRISTRSVLGNKVVLFFFPNTHNTRKPDSLLLLHWPQREGDCTSSSQGWCWHQHAQEGHTLTYAPRHACTCWQEGAHTHTISSLATPSDMSPLQLLQHHESQLVSKQHSVMCSTYPVSPKSCACTLCLHTSEKWKVAEFRENQQQHSLHSLGRHLNTWDGWKIIYP